MELIDKAHDQAEKLEATLAEIAALPRDERLRVNGDILELRVLIGEIWCGIGDIAHSTLLGPPAGVATETSHAV